MKQFIWLIGLLTCFCFPASLLAQFHGGKGDGQGMGQLLQSNLLGQPMGLQALLSGGNGDGHDKSINYTSVNGLNTNSLFMGGQGDGADLSINTLSIEGANLAQMFAGGDGDGHDAFAAQNALSGEDLSIMFYGGMGDGHDQSRTQIIVDGTEISSMFNGGEGDGHDVVDIQSFLSGDNLNVMFGGGEGDGHDVSQYNGIVPFPVVLLSFEAFPEETFVLLQWVTESEQNSDYFTIEKTRDGQLFLPVVNVPAAGQSDEMRPYEAIDPNPYEGQSFYRLKAVDFDGAFMYSHLVEVMYSNDVRWDFSLFPNPSSGQMINLDLQAMSEGDLVQIEVLDMKGRYLFRKSQVIDRDGIFHTQLDLGSRLAEGSYLVRVINGNQGQQAKILLVH